MKAVTAFLFLSLIICCAYSQQNKDIQSYVTQYKHIAIEEMIRTGIPASITLAQGILESGCGKSPLSQIANNHFGIKCKTEWTGERYFQDDDEAQECFRVYEHAEASYVDHSDFLLTRYWYAPLFQLPPTDYKAWAHGLKSVGYATNPKYASILITHIENYDLHQLDLIAMELLEEKNKLLGLSEQPAIQKGNKEQQTAAVIEKSRNEFLVNGVRATRAEGKEDPLDVALEYNIDYKAILMFNELSEGERFKKGEHIFLHRKKLNGEEPTWTVLPGESMRDISQRLGIQLKEMYALNLMKPNEQPYPTETLFLRDKRSSPPRTMSYSEFLEMQVRINTPQPDKIEAANTQTENKATSEYRVQKSDTLYSIAQKFNISVQQLQQINKLDSTLLKPGQVLLVSN